MQQLDPNFADFVDQFDDEEYTGSLADSTTTSSTNNTPSSTPIGGGSGGPSGCHMCMANFLHTDSATGCPYCS